MGLFKKKSKAPEENPYAAAPTDSYGREIPQMPTRPAAISLPTDPRNSNGLSSGFRGGSTYSQTPPPSYGASQAPGSANEKLGSAAGYGSNRFDQSNMSLGSQSTRMGLRSLGGYGGLGSADEDATRGDLFAGASTRAQPLQSSSAGYHQSSSGASYSGGGGSFGGYREEREMSQEDPEQAEVQATKNEMNQVRMESVNSLDRSIQSGQAGLDAMASTINRLASQQARLANTEKNLDYANISNRIAEEKTSELKRLNRSMFVPAGLSKKKEEGLLRKKMEDHVRDREDREGTRKDAYHGQQRLENGMTQLGTGRPSQLGGKSSAAERSKYTFEDDDGEQEVMEDQIDDKMDQLGKMVSQMNYGAKLVGEEVDSQNRLIDRIAEKSDKVDDGIRFNKEKLNRIR